MFTIVSKKFIRALKENKFEKQYSVFKNWKEDTSYTYDRCLQHDFKYWKCPKFTKDPDDLKECISIIKENFADIKEIFLQVAAYYGLPPDIKQLDF